eukprot:TRINITY_DN62697_c0_g1_i1.p1 TRINITY_DN62697_c0_g1~~TRINITY_DN62697_c0_g1_i1.p1  ORF type:complete len:457 (+),score=88.81 TRINITY_DN62697_c0_g1_i1:64-1434(+)
MSVSEMSERGVQLYMTFFMQVTFQTSGSIILMPWTFATLGYISGPILMVVFFCVILMAQYWLNQAALDQPCGTASTLKDLAYRVGGRRVGRLAVFVQVANMVLLMPAELSVCSSALQFVVHIPAGSPAHCNIIYILIVAVPSVLATQFVRKFGHKTGTLAGISLLVILTKSFLIVFSILRHADLYSSDAAAASGTNNWADVISALGNFLWIFAPVFINTELVAVMQKPKQVHCQLLMTAVCITCIYVVVGVTGAYTWGAACQSPVNLQLPYAWDSIAVNCLLLYGAGLDYLIGSIVTSGYLQEALEPGFDKGDFSAKGCLRWLMFSLPANMFAVVLLSVVPRFETLVGVVTATAVSLASFTLPAFVGISLRRFREANKEEEQADEAIESVDDGSSEGRRASNAEMSGCWSTPLMQWMIASLGIVAMMTLLTSEVYFIATADYVITSAEQFFCEVAR